MSIHNGSFHPENELYLWLLLAFTPKVGPVTALKLIRHFGGIQNIHTQSVSTIAQVINKTLARLIIDKVAEPQATQALQWLNPSLNQYIITIASDLYPTELAQIVDPPLVLFLSGDILRLQQKKFAIVGTRHPSYHGTKNAFNFARDIANHGFTVVSGMAMGIDKAAHSGAVTAACSTIGVVGTGIDQRYPKSNSELYDEVLNNRGLLVSEFPLNTPPLIGNFPRRNRIIAGLSQGLLVIESALDGGSMLSANFALEMGREVMAIPGSIHNPMARGCHKLIKAGAKLVENSNDVLEDLCLESGKVTYNGVQKIADDPGLLANIGYEPITLDAICANEKIDFADACAMLLELELDGKIVNCGGGTYQRVYT